MFKVYLAGPITGLSYKGATDWREDAAYRLLRHQIVAISPMRGKEYLLHETSLADSSNKHIETLQHSLVTRDRYDIMQCDVLLVNLIGAKKVSIGTMVELGWADAFRKPVILIMESGNSHDHAFVRELAGFIVPTLDAAIDLLRVIRV